jgi:hypothetical protein
MISWPVVSSLRATTTGNHPVTFAPYHVGALATRRTVEDDLHEAVLHAAGAGFLPEA